MGDVRFFTMADDAYFLGAVGLVNSLRLLGHDEPIVVLDLGLGPENRERLEADCRLVQPPPEMRDTHPWAQKLVALDGFDGVAVIVDSDVAFAAPIDDLVRIAEMGKVVAFAEPVRRFFPEWSSIFELSAPLRTSQPYVNTGVVVMHTRLNRRLFNRWRECLHQLEGLPKLRLPASHPTALLDQDAFNAVLMSEVPESMLAIQDAVGQPLGKELARTSIDDVASLRCSLDGRTVRVLHSIHSPKPWFPAAGRSFPRSAYLVCLGRLLDRPDVAIQVPESQIPPWLRSRRRAVARRIWMHGAKFVARGVAWARYRARRVKRRLRREEG